MLCQCQQNATQQKSTLLEQYFSTSIQQSIAMNLNSMIFPKNQYNVYDNMLSRFHIFSFEYSDFCICA